MRQIRFMAMSAASLWMGFLPCGCEEKTQDASLIAAPDQQVPAEPVPSGANDPALAATEASPPATSTGTSALRPVPAEPVEPLPKESYAPAKRPSPRVHVVKKGETLSLIAKRYYNNKRLWRRIYEANRDRLKDPNKLDVGMKLTIP